MKTTINAILVITAFAFFSCDKTGTTDGIDLTITDLSATQLKSASLTVNDVAVEAVAEEANFETEFYAGYEQMLRQLAHVKGKKGNLLMGQGHFHYVEGQLPVVSIDKDESGYPITITIDYGTGIKTNHDHLISGIVTIEISAPKNIDGSTRTITYDKCAIDAIGVTGTVTETFNSTNATNQTITCDSDVTFTLADGTKLDWVGTNVRNWIKGLDTPKERDDDQIEVTGTVTVTSTKTDATPDTYSRVISDTDPLIRLGDCKHPVQGIVTYSKNDEVVGELNYGDGTCDNLGTMTTADGTLIEIELKGEGKMPKAKTEGQHKGKMKGNGNGHKGGKSGGMNGGMSGGMNSSH